MRELGGLRLAVTTFTILPLRGGRLDRREAGRAMAWGPAVGGVLAAVAALGIVVMRYVMPDKETIARIVCAAVGVGLMAVFTRGLHLDGLADTSDALGVRDRGRALDVMKRPEIGAFGVLALLFAVLLQTTALAAADVAQHGSRVLVCGVVTGRIAITWATSRRVPAARGEGLGALVAGTVPRVVPAVWSLAAIAGGATWAWFDDRGRAPSAFLQGMAIVLALLVTRFVQARLVKRFGGITGDVLGALSEIATTIAMVLAAGAPHPYGFHSH
jgi:adenosylcobinamide-GDP ribazoletransferase